MIPTKPHISASALVPSIEAYQALHERSISDPAGFWGEQAQQLTWFHPPDSVVENRHYSEDIDINWFAGGRLNACYNAVDRHAQSRPDDVAIIWAANEAGEYKRITWRHLKRQVSRVANVLKSHGVRRGDRVCIYLPMIPELAYAVLACARIGAIHSVVFAGFSAEALRDRILDAQSKVLITANEGLRGAKHIGLKHIVDTAVEGISLVERVLVVRHTDADVPMKVGRDIWLHEDMARHRATCPVEWMASEDPLFILYTSGSTGKPKGVMHTTAGYLIYAATTHRFVFDIREGSVYFCAADIGWITGHSYILYGPLTNGVTTVMFESLPTYPDAGRYWQIVDDLGVDIFYTAPTALRAIMAQGDSYVTQYSRKSLRVLGTVGEPINPEVWQWYHDVVGEGRCAVVDTWWQTETGGILITPLPGATPVKPGSATLPFFGVEPLLVDDEGNEVLGNGVQGNLCMRGSWPGQARSIWGDHGRFTETYFERFPGLYFTGDGCRRDEDGYYWITGRVDDVLNISGHRLGTAEVESALVSHEAVVEAAVVGYPHPLKGQGIFAWVQVGSDYADWDPEELHGALKQQVRQVIGAIATPDRILIVPALPKTRSGKIMRRILRKLAAGETTNLGDLSTLADATVVDALIAASQA